MRCSRGVIPLLLAGVLLATSAQAAPPVPPAVAAAAPNTALAFMAGAASALVPVTLGAVLTSSGSSYAERNVGLGVVGAGFVLGPLVGHALLGEWKRAAFFSAMPALSELGMVALMEAREDAVFRGTKVSRATFSVLLCVDMVFSMIGLVDVALGDARARQHGVVVAPAFARDRIGIAVGGPL